MKRSLFQLLISLAVLVFVLSFTAEAQNKTIPAANVPNPTIIVEKAGVYVTYERLGKRTPLREDEGGEGVWLRLNNNMRHSISVCAFNIPEEDGQASILSENSQMGVKYDIVLNSVAITDDKPNIDVPVGYNTGSTCTVFKIKSGKSLVFVVPAEHLVKGLSIKIPFSYEWEAETVNNPTHFVFFNSLDISKKEGAKR